MKTIARKLSVGLGPSNGSWLTALLLLVVIVPSVCLLWFMKQAVDNEQLAMRQKLAEAYRGHLALAQQLLEAQWKQTAEELEAQAAELTPSALFAQQARARTADAVIVFGTNGVLAYPDRLTATQVEPRDPAWITARDLEVRNPAAAASAYAQVAAQTPDLHLAAQALQAQARCLLRTGERAAAVAVLTGPLSEPRFQSAMDGNGRWIQPNAELMLWELLKQSNDDRAAAVLARLTERLNDYDRPLPAAQRRFLMRELSRQEPNQNLFPTLAAEDLAARFLEAGGIGFRDPVLRATPLPEVWQFASRRGRVVTLHETESLLARLRQALPAMTEPKVRVEFLRPEQAADESLLSQMAGATLQGWRLSLSLQDQQLFEAGSKQRAQRYVAVAVLAVAVVTALALLALGLIRRQTALTQLRNDLVANVTHELKTPLASTRLLVETLLQAEKIEEKTAREYLELIARENIRLSRLIENFLTFSRIERNKYTFDFKDVPAGTIASAAVAAVRERFNVPGCRFEARIPKDAPRVRADSDALVTALLNLLDNAYKYTGESKEIAFSVETHNGSVVFAVKDNGIGLAPRDVQQVFKRFYQVNQHLSRSSGGAGLGLSIVQFIVTAHQGTVEVASELEKGSTFSVTIPVAAPSVNSEPRNEKEEP